MKLSHLLRFVGILVGGAGMAAMAPLARFKRGVFYALKDIGFNLIRAAGSPIGWLSVYRGHPHERLLTAGAIAAVLFAAAGITIGSMEPGEAKFYSYLGLATAAVPIASVAAILFAVASASQMRMMSEVRARQRMHAHETARQPIKFSELAEPLFYSR